MKHKRIVVAERGGPEVIRIVEKDLRPPSPGEARIKVLASPVVQDDIAIRAGNRPFLAKTPFTPGYSILGVVDEVGEGVTEVAVGDRVAALTSFGGHAVWVVSIVYVFGDWENFPFYNKASSGNWCDFELLPGVGSSLPGISTLTMRF